MRLFLQHEHRIYGLILAMMAYGPDADDVMQETAAVMWRKFDDFTPGTNFAAWSLRVARFQVMAHRKRVAISRVRFSDQTMDAIADQVATVAEQPSARRDALRQCLSKLRERDRQLVELRYEPGATTQGVADQVGRSIHAVYKALNKIHTQLLECVRKTLSAEGIRS